MQNILYTVLDSTGGSRKYRAHDQYGRQLGVVEFKDFFLSGIMYRFRRSYWFQTQGIGVLYR
jgi:hypothetical protein